MRVPGFGAPKRVMVDPVTGQAVPADTVATAPAGTYVTDGVTRAEADREKQLAYERGLREGVRTRRNNPVLTLIVVLLALLGLVTAMLAIVSGGFSEGGARLDGLFGQAADEAREVGTAAQDAAGETAQDAGAALQSTGEKVERDAEAAR